MGSPPLNASARVRASKLDEGFDLGVNYHKPDIFAFALEAKRLLCLEAAGLPKPSVSPGPDTRGLLLTAGLLEEERSSEFKRLPSVYCRSRYLG